MIEFLTIALAAVMIPAATLNTVNEVDYNNANVSNYVYQTNENYITTFGNNSTIIIKTPNGSDAYAEVTSSDFASEEERDMYTYYFSNHPELNLNPEVVNFADYSYNSYAYAWYMHWTDNPKYCLLYNMQPFINDISFIEVDSPQVDDIIMYYAYYKKDGEYKPVHSGIVVGFTGENSNNVCGNANTVEVESKWNIFGLYRHKGDECPYISIYNISNGELDFGENATEVRYFRRHTQHDFTYSYHNNGTGTHIAYCRCGESTTEGHTFNTGYANLGNGTHSVKCACGASRTESHTLTYQSKSSTIHVGTCSCGHSEEGNNLWTSIPNPFLSLLGLDEDYIDPLSISPTKFYKCVICGYVKEVSSGEIVPIVPDF